MKSKDFFGKFMDRYLWGNIVAMVIVVVLLCLGVKYGLEIYTHHGESILVPNVKGMSYDKAMALIESDKLRIVVSDTGYNKRLPADCILMQTPESGTEVKADHVIYVVVNSSSSPSVVIPDLIDNSSVREANAKLMAMGFKLLEPKLISGEKDWVYGIMSRGRRLSTGDRVAIDIPLTLLIGSGMYDDSTDVNFVDPADVSTGDDSDVDEFQEVTEKPATSTENGTNK